VNRSVVIAGGGLAGSAAACVLALAGRPVLLLEREAAQVPKICGEFISAETAVYLQRLGVDLNLLGAHRIDRLRLVRGRAMVRSKLPFVGFGLSRGILDEALLQRAAACGAEIRRGQTVNRIRTGDDLTLELGGGGDIRAKTLFLATGKHDVRGLRRELRVAPEDLVGFKLHLLLSPAQQREMAGHVDLMLFAGGYAGLQLVEDGIANLCLLVGAAYLRDAGGTWIALLQNLRQAVPHLQTRLEGAVQLETVPVSISRVPYGFVHVATPADPVGVFRLGDQVGVIPSFTGDGMAIALHSAALAASAYLEGAAASTYHRRIRNDIAGQIGRAVALYRWARGAIGQSMLMQVAAWPGSLGLAAEFTRIAPRAVARALMQIRS